MLANENTLLQTHFWTEQLGLMPVPLRATADETFVMLNGAKGNFCLQLSSENVAQGSNSDPRGISWSSNVGHHVTVNSQRVEIYRWDTKASALERFSTSSVEKNVGAFYAYLEKSAPSAEDSVVTHAIRTFRSLRNSFINPAQEDGIQALKAFLLLLACAVENQPEATVETLKWALPQETEAARAEISTDKWLALYRTLTQQLPREQLRLYLDLTLRHASGPLFQEAHFEAYRSSQLSMDLGLTPPPIKVKFENKAAGLYFTPPALVRILVEEALRILEPKKPDLVIFDPACGSAEFLREALRQLFISKYSGKVKLIGWDISPAACDMARFILHREVTDWNAFSRVEILIQEGDSLAEGKDWPQSVDLVLMNPPFVRWNEMTPDHKEATERLLVSPLELGKSRPSGNYDLSHVFLVQAAQCLSETGILATILPVSVLDSKAASKVRGHLGEILEANIIARLGSHSLFSNALVDAAFYIGHRRGAVQSNSIPLAFWSDHRSSSSSAGFRELRSSHARNSDSQISEAIQEDKTGFCYYFQKGLGDEAEHWLPRPSKAWKLLQKLEDNDNLPSIGELFQVERGVIPGNLRAFVLSEKQWNELPFQERKYFRSSINNDDIQNGRLVACEYVFYPYGNNTIDSEIQLRKSLPRYYQDFLQPLQSVLESRRGSKWWMLERPRETQSENKGHLLSAHRGSPGAFAWDVNGDFMVLQGFGWRSKGSKVLTDTLGLSYLAILNSSLFFRLVSAVSHHVSGGQWDLSKRYVDQLPIPNLFDAGASPDLIEELSQIGRSIQKQGLPREGLSEESLGVVARSYGLELDEL